MKRTIFGTVTMSLLAAGVAHGQGDPAVIEQIIDEGKNSSQVWEHLLYISEQIGPRLTGSSRLMEANAWTRDKFRSMGCTNVHLFKWGEIAVRFDRGPSYVRMLEPMGRDFEFTTRSWSAGTAGPVQGVVLKEPKTMEELEAVRDQLEGAWILSTSSGRGGRRGVVDDAEARAAGEISAALAEAGIAGRVYAARGEIVNTSGRFASLEWDGLPTDVSVTVRRSDYDAINSRLSDGETVVIEADLQNHFVEGPFPMFNTIAEIPGTEFPDEVVIISAHLDSWDGPGSMGTQDNGTGSSVTLEAARILNSVGVKPRRTIRFCLWTGEEQGLLGSRAYVESLSEEELSKISAVFVDDGGTNYQGGLQCVEAMAPMLADATAAVNEAFPDMPVEIDVRQQMPRGGGSDHASFNRAGVPGFFWTEKGSGGREGKTYRFVWHTQHDTPRYAVEEYLVQASTCSAVTAYNLAMADSLLPRYNPDAEGAEPAEPAIPEDDESNWTTVEGPLSGTWKAELTAEDAPEDAGFTLTFEMADDGRVRGQIESQIGQGDLRRETFDAESGKLSFLFASDAMGSINFTAELKNGVLTGTVGVSEEFSMPFKATKQERDDG